MAHAAPADRTAGPPQLRQRAGQDPGLRDAPDPGAGLSGTGPLRLGVLGCASVAWRRTLPAVLASEHVDLVAVASREAATAQRFARRFGGAAVTGYAELLERPDVEAVYVPLPTGLHAHWCARALRAGKHVLAEKPLAASHAEAVELAALAAERGLCLTENRMFAHHPQHEFVRRMVEEDAIGALRVMHATMAFPPLPDEDVRYRADLGGGALLDAGYYPLQAAMLLLTEPLEVLGADLPVDPARGVEVRGDVLLRDARGVCAHLAFGFDHGYRSSYELWGSKGRLVLERAFTPPESWQPVVRVERHNRVEELTLPAAPQFRNSLEHFAAAVRAGGGLEAHLATAVRGAALMDAVRRTAHR